MNESVLKKEDKVLNGKILSTLFIIALKKLSKKVAIQDKLLLPMIR